MRIIVTGGRHSKDQKLVVEWLDNFWGSLPRGDHLFVAQGGAPGVDKFAREWCMACGVNFVNYPYPSEYGRAGGPIRNERMATDFKPDIVVAFPGGAGTASMVKIARDLGIKVIEVTSDGNERSNPCTIF